MWKKQSFFETADTANEQVDLALVVGYGDETPAIHERVENNLIYIH